jgi:hypothetical protein
MKIIIERELIQHINQLLFYGNNKEAYAETNKILEEHPRKTDGVLGVEVDEWPDYAPVHDKDEALQTLKKILQTLQDDGYIEAGGISI